MKNTTPKADFYTRITNQIIADLETGVRPWVKPGITANLIPASTSLVSGHPQRFKDLHP